MALRRWLARQATRPGLRSPLAPLAALVAAGTVLVVHGEPSPVQRGQAPCGELNENERGSSSGIEIPQCRQAKRSEYDVITGSEPSRGTVSTSMIPSASATAVTCRSLPYVSCRPAYASTTRTMSGSSSTIKMRSLTLTPA